MFIITYNIVFTIMLTNVSVISQFPSTEIYVAEAEDKDLPPNNGIRFSIESIKFVINGKKQAAPTAFTVNANDGTVAIGTNDYTDYIGGHFEIIVKAEDRGINSLVDYMNLTVSTYSYENTIFCEMLVFVYFIGKLSTRGKVKMHYSYIYIYIYDNKKTDQSMLLLESKCMNLIFWNMFYSSL